MVEWEDHWSGLKGDKQKSNVSRGKGRHLGSCHQWLPVLIEQPGTAQPRPYPGMGGKVGLGGRSSRKGVKGCILPSWPKPSVVGEWGSHKASSGVF